MKNINKIRKAPSFLYGLGASGSTFYPGSLASILQQSKSFLKIHKFFIFIYSSLKSPVYYHYDILLTKIVVLPSCACLKKILRMKIIGG